MPMRAACLDGTVLAMAGWSRTASATTTTPARNTAIGRYGPIHRPPYPTIVSPQRDDCGDQSVENDFYGEGPVGSVDLDADGHEGHRIDPAVRHGTDIDAGDHGGDEPQHARADELARVASFGRSEDDVARNNEEQLDPDPPEPEPVDRRRDDAGKRAGRREWKGEAVMISHHHRRARKAEHVDRGQGAIRAGGLRHHAPAVSQKG
ncbi:hypothetical protein WR25_25881 [Diploscapter pachys]|uniref:Uncharacterized protein n=1 Tax=Diploscapter pachys TaxID=2018661 RepID=A0A2A2M2I4_9BILA|nr:hypothetical protein WR25_25881 [Diploscapter pachys]